MSENIYANDPPTVVDSLVSKAYAVLKATPVGEICTYEALSVALDIPLSQRQRIQSRALAAAERLLTHDKHAITAVDNEGYRIARAEEHLPIAASKQKKSRKIWGKSVKVITHTDANELTPGMQQDRQKAIIASSYVAEIMHRANLKKAGWQKFSEMVQQKKEVEQL